MATIKNTPQSELIESQTCPSALQELVDLVDTQLETVLGPLGFDLEIIYAEIKGKQAGDLWDAVVTGPLEAAGSAVEEAFGYDPTSISASKAEIENALTAIVDPNNILAALTPIKELGGALLSTDKLVEGDLSPTGLINQILDPTKEKQLDGLTECNENVVTATAATITQVVAGAANEVLKKVGAAQSILSMGMSQLENFGEGLFLLAGDALNTVHNAEIILIDQILDVLVEMRALVEEMGNEPFGFNHSKVVQAAQTNLLQADSLLSAVQAKIETRAGFDGTSYDAARSIIQYVEELLCEASDEFDLGFSSKPYRLLSLVLTLEAYQALWYARAQKGESSAEGLISFPGSLLSQLQTDNFFSPIIALVRCQLNKVIQDMADTDIRGELLLYITKEKKWCLELKVLNETMKASRSLLEAGDEAAEFSDLILEGVETYEDTKKLVTATAAEAQESITDVLTYARLKVQNQLTPTNRVTSRIDEAVSILTLRRSQIQAQSQALLSLLGLGNTDFLQGLAYAKQFAEFLSGKGLDAMLGSLLDGDFDGVFGADALTASIGGKVEAYATKVLGCLDTQDPSATDKLYTVAKQANDDLRAQDVLVNLIDGSASLFAQGALLEAQERSVDLSTIELS